MMSRGPSRMIDFRRGRARYVATAPIASGGMAEVWQGEAHFEDGEVQPVAIKRVLPGLAANPLYRRMLEDEARVGMLLKHPNIVRVFDGRDIRGTFIIIMELVDGASMREVLRRLHGRGAHMPLAAALFIAREVASALEHAHEAIDDMGRSLDLVHRDVSPHNVLLGADGSVKLMDFGLANASANLAERDPGMIGGKFGYIAPELILRREASHRLDLFALGVVLWEATTGKRLFQGRDDGETVCKVARCEVPPAARYNPLVTPDLQTVLDNLLAADPEQRYQSAREVRVDLDYLCAQFEAEEGASDVATLVGLLQKSQASQRQSVRTGGQGLRVVPPVPATTMTVTESGTRAAGHAARDLFDDELRTFSAAERAERGRR